MTSSASKVTFATEIPQDLKSLVAFVSRGFYPYDHAIVMDYLIHYPCLKEDDIVELLKYDRKQLRSIMNFLKNDKLVKTKIRLETSADGKSQKHNYWYINYQVMVNVIKYKLDHMRRRIETEERVSTNRASFVCPTCAKTFTDLEVDQLFDPMSGLLRCSYCGSEVEEEGSKSSAKDSRTVLVKFNEQFQRLFDLLRKVENVKLAPELLDPDPTVLSVARSGRTQNAKPRDPDAAWSGDATRSSGFDYKSTVTINYDEAGDAAAEEVRRKERLAWMEESTVQGSMAESVWKDDAAASTDASSSKLDAANKTLSRDIFNTLLVHEKKGRAPGAVGGGLNAGANEADSSESDSDEDGAASRPKKTRVEEDGDGDVDEDDDEDTPVVLVGGEQIPLDEVDDVVIARMTPQERDGWIQLTQKIYADHYD